MSGDGHCDHCDVDCNRQTVGVTEMLHSNSEGSAYWDTCPACAERDKITDLLIAKWRELRAERKELERVPYKGLDCSKLRAMEDALTDMVDAINRGDHWEDTA